MIIDQWYTTDIKKINEAIRIKDSDDDKYDIIINGIKMASVDDKETADILVNKLTEFNERYRRDVDTFDIAKELNTIKNNKDADRLGSYFS